MIDKKTWGGTTSVSSYSYTYDAIETAAKWNPSYSYDQIGNRKTSTGIESVTYSANALNQYADIQVSSLSSQPFYDLDGNLTGDGGNWTYNWNNENRLASATDGSRTIHFTYDYQGRLVKKDDGRTIEVYVYDGWNRIATFDSQVSTLSLQVSYLWGLDLSGSFQGAGGVGGLLKEGTLYPIYDANGNITQKLNSKGTAIMHVDYDPFGNIVVGVLIGEYGFSTKPLVDDLDWYYYGFRYYDPVTGRWPNRDPIGERGGLNLYGFVGNNPIRWYDFLGLSEPDCGCDDKGNKIKPDTDDAGRQCCPYEMELVDLVSERPNYLRGRVGHTWVETSRGDACGYYPQGTYPTGPGEVRDDSTRQGDPEGTVTYLACPDSVDELERRIEETALSQNTYDIGNIGSGNANCTGRSLEWLHGAGFSGPNPSRWGSRPGQFFD
jgi:RHS repeat-associated protein